jgi:hypothetical protein
MEKQFITDNNRERERLKKLVNRLTDEELNLVIYKEGWTIAVVLAHLAFWDQYGLSMLRRWKQSGVAVSPTNPSRSDTTPINDALFPIAMSIPPRPAAELAITSAEAVDKEIATESPEFVKAVEAIKQPYRLNRSVHRKMHLDEIEAFLKARHTTK